MTMSCASPEVETLLFTTTLYMVKFFNNKTQWSILVSPYIIGCLGTITWIIWSRGSFSIGFLRRNLQILRCTSRLMLTRQWFVHNSNIPLQSGTLTHKSRQTWSKALLCERMIPLDDWTKAVTITQILTMRYCMFCLRMVRFSGKVGVTFIVFLSNSIFRSQSRRRLQTWGGTEKRRSFRIQQLSSWSKWQK